MNKVFTTLLVYLIMPLVAFAAFNDVQLSSGSTLVITVGGTALEFAVTSGNVETLTVDGTTFSMTLLASSGLVITSNDRRNFDYGASSGVTTAFTCGASSSRLDISSQSGTGSFSVTPLGTICTVSSGGSGGGSGSNGGGGGGGAAAPSPAPTPAPTPAPKPAPVAALVTQVPSVAVPASQVAKPSPVAQLVSPVFNKDLQRGDTSDDVKRIQQLLLQDKSIYPEGLATGFFGPATERAVKRFQAKHGLSQVGRVGPQTRAKIQEVFAAPVPAPVVPVAPAVAKPSPVAQLVSPVFNTSLEKGMTSDDVKRLQQLLATDSELYPEAITSGYFGGLTEKAVQRFQKKYGLASEGDSAYGFVGPKTRAKLQEIFGNQQPASAQPSVTQPAADDSAQRKAIQKQLDDLKKQLDVLLKKP